MSVVADCASRLMSLRSAGRISPTAVCVGLAIADHFKRPDDEVVVTREEIGARCGIRRMATITKCVGELMETEFLTVEWRRRKNTYRLRVDE